MDIIQTDISYAEDFVNIYNSAIRLFPKNQRSDATVDIFTGLLKRQEAYICLINSFSAGFITFRNVSCGIYELGSLYVHLDYQNKGVGKSLLLHMEQEIEKDSFIYAKVLSNAPWSISFYEKNGFTFATAEELNFLKVCDNSWERIMVKKV